jgi:hypothetical protein
MEPEKKDHTACKLGQRSNVLPHDLTQIAGHNSESKKHGAETQNEENRA